MGAPYSDFRQVDGWTVLSGVVGRRGDVAGVDLDDQLHLVFAEIDRRLGAAGLTRRHVVKATVWLADMGDWEHLNDAYLAYFEGVSLPARTTVGAQLLPGLLVEVEVWAHASAG